MKERLLAIKRPHSGDDGDDGEAKESKGSKSTSRQKRFKTGDRIDNIYFGTPGLANIVQDVSVAKSLVRYED